MFLPIQPSGVAVACDLLELGLTGRKGAGRHCLARSELTDVPIGGTGVFQRAHQMMAMCCPQQLVLRNEVKLRSQIPQVGEGVLFLGQFKGGV